MNDKGTSDRERPASSWEELLPETSSESAAEYFAQVELQYDIEDVTQGKLSRVDDPDGEIGAKSRRLHRFYSEAILRGEVPPGAFLEFVARGILHYLDGQSAHLESALKLTGQHGKQQLTPDEEAVACRAFSWVMLQRDRDDDPDGSRTRWQARDAAYEAIYGASPDWHTANPDSDGNPSARTIRDRLNRTRSLLKKHGYWPGSDYD